MAVKEGTTVLEALKISRAAALFFERHGMRCLSCKGAKNETIAQWANSHGFNPGSVVREINSLDEELGSRP